MSEGRWVVRLSAAAEADYGEILRWTAQRFSLAQARTYAQTLSAALTDLTGGPAIAGVRERSEIASGLLALHVARNGRKGRHFVLFRARHERDGGVIEVLRLLHDAMDLQRHLPGSGS